MRWAKLMTRAATTAAVIGRRVVVSAGVLDRVLGLVCPRVGTDASAPGWEFGCDLGLLVSTTVSAVLHVSRFTSAVEVWAVGVQPEDCVHAVTTPSPLGILLTETADGGPRYNGAVCVRDCYRVHRGASASAAPRHCRMGCSRGG